jgi:hypothetical protein
LCFGVDNGTTRFFFIEKIYIRQQKIKIELTNFYQQLALKNFWVEQLQLDNSIKLHSTNFEHKWIISVKKLTKLELYGLCKFVNYLIKIKKKEKYDRVENYINNLT